MSSSIADVDTTGVSQIVIDRVTKWYKAWTKRKARRGQDEVGNIELSIRDDGYGWITRVDAAYIVQVLRATSIEQLCRMTSLVLSSGDNDFTDEAVDAVCDFLQHPATTLPALKLYGSSEQHFRRLIESLHSNTSIKELTICALYNDDRALAVAELLQHKTDFAVLTFKYCSVVPHILPFLRRGFASLRKLSLFRCSIDDNGIQSIMEALVEGNHHERLEELDVGGNDISSQGLEYMCQLSRFSQLKKIVARGNYHLLKNKPKTQQFVRAILPVGQETPLKELDFARCSDSSGDYLPFIVACEDLKVKLDSLHISPDDEHNHHAMCKQLVKSMPKIKGLRHLIAHPGFYTALFHEDNRNATMMSFRQNTSVLQFSAVSYEWDTDPEPVSEPFLVSLSQRNRHMMHLPSLLRAGNKLSSSTSSADGGTKKTTASFLDLPRIPWSRALAKVGRGSEGASPVYTILLHRLATWEEQRRIKNNYNKYQKPQAVTTRSEQGQVKKSTTTTTTAMEGVDEATNSPSTADSCGATLASLDGETLMDASFPRTVAASVPSSCSPPPCGFESSGRLLARNNKRKMVSRKESSAASTVHPPIDANKTASQDLASLKTENAIAGATTVAASSSLTATTNDPPPSSQNPTPQPPRASALQTLRCAFPSLTEEELETMVTEAYSELSSNKRQRRDDEKNHPK